MNLQALRRRVPLVVFILLALVCLALLGFACACLSDHPLQALERALAAVPALPAVVEVFPAVVLALLAAALVLSRRPLERPPSFAQLQRFLF